MRVPLRLFLSVCGLCAAVPAFAQEDLSVDELLERFENQKKVFGEADSNGLGETRGLKLVTVDDVNAEPATGSVSVSASGDQMPTDPNTPIAASADTDEPMIFGQLDPELQVNLHIKFDFDSAALSDAETPKLDKICAVLRQSSINLVRIVGHTDTSGPDSYNDNLSVLRAREVARHLTEECGIDPSRLETVGMGERFPIDTANPRSEENRRVEFQALS